MQEIAPGIFIETTLRGPNVGAIITREGVICVDTPPYPADARRWHEELTRQAPGRILYVINLDHHRDRVLGNSWMNAPVIAHEATAEKLRGYGQQFPQPIIDALASRDPDSVPDFARVRVVMPQITLARRMTLMHGGRTVHLMHMPGPTPGALWVHCPEEGVLFTGDSVVLGTHPWLAEAQTKPWLDSLALLRRDRMQVKRLVPGRGPIGDKGAAETIAGYLRLVRSRVRSLHSAARPRSDTGSLVAELLRQYPAVNESRERLQRRIKAGLDHVYDEFKLSDEEPAEE